MKFYSFHPGMKLTCKQKFFHPGRSFIPGWDSVLVTCKRTLNGLNEKTHRTVMFAFGSKFIPLPQSKRFILKGLCLKRLTILGDLIFSGVKTLTSKFSDMTSSSIFLTWLVSLAKCSYWSKFHVNIIAGSGVMTIFNYNGLTRNPEIGNTSVWVFPNIWRLGQVRDTKFNTNINISNEMLQNAVKCQV